MAFFSPDTSPVRTMVLCLVGLRFVVLQAVGWSVYSITLVLVGVSLYFGVQKVTSGGNACRVRTFDTAAAANPMSLRPFLSCPLDDSFLRSDYGCFTGERII